MSSQKNLDNAGIFYFWWTIYFFCFYVQIPKYVILNTQFPEAIANGLDCHDVS